MKKLINPKACPFCKKDNNCMADIPNNNCWCNDIKVPEDLREFIPDEFKLKACICKECILLFKKIKRVY